MEVMWVLKHKDQKPFSNHIITLIWNEHYMITKGLLVYALEHQHNLHFTIFFDSQCKLTKIFTIKHSSFSIPPAVSLHFNDQFWNLTATVMPYLPKLYERWRIRPQFSKPNLPFPCPFLTMEKVELCKVKRMIHAWPDSAICIGHNSTDNFSRYMYNVRSVKSLILPPFHKSRNAPLQSKVTRVTWEFPADDDETSRVNEAPTPS